MVRRTDIDPEMLNAYVDGELDVSEAASVARAAADNPSVAARIATMRELKAAVADAVPQRELSLPAPNAAVKWAGGVAAAVAAFIAVGALLHLSTFRESNGERWARLIADKHAAWSFTPGSRSAPIVLSGVGANLLPLDLKSARLTFVGHEITNLDGKPVLRTEYEGTRGCKVSLYAFASVESFDASRLNPALLVRHWKIGDHGFVLMARGMAAGRFAGLAVAVEKALRSGYELDKKTRQQLAHARKTSPPCQA